MAIFKAKVSSVADVFFNGKDEKDAKEQYDRMLAGGTPINVLEQLGKGIILESITEVKGKGPAMKPTGEIGIGTLCDILDMETGVIIASGRVKNMTRRDNGDRLISFDDRFYFNTAPGNVRYAVKITENRVRIPCVLEPGAIIPIANKNVTRQDVYYDNGLDLLPNYMKDLIDVLNNDMGIETTGCAVSDNEETWIHMRFDTFDSLGEFIRILTNLDLPFYRTLDLHLGKDGRGEIRWSETTDPPLTGKPMVAFELSSVSRGPDGERQMAEFTEYLTKTYGGA